jgi:hypothetical protein
MTHPFLLLLIAEIPSHLGNAESSEDESDDEEIVGEGVVGLGLGEEEGAGGDDEESEKERDGLGFVHVFYSNEWF